MVLSLVHVDGKTEDPPSEIDPETVFHRRKVTSGEGHSRLRV